MELDGQLHPHSFLRDGAETRNTVAVAKENHGITVKSAIAGLLVLKTTGSAFHGFVQDEYTILQETNDRILSTEVDCSWTWKTFDNLAAVQKEVPKFDPAWNFARNITLKTFAQDASASVQNTMYKMCEQILGADSTVDSVDYTLPNKHYFEIGKRGSYNLRVEINANNIERSKLAQRPEEHREGCRSVRSSVQP